MLRCCFYLSLSLPPIMSGCNRGSGVREARAAAGAAVRVLLGVLKLQARFIFFEEGAEVVGNFEQAVPLFVIQGDREASQAVHADAAFFSHAKFQSAAAFRAGSFLF